jgi:uracil-DNA glycosylase family 4
MLITSEGFCVDCKLSSEGCRTVKMQASGEGRRGIMIVGEAPGEEEDIQGKPFVGRSGRYLRAVFEAFGLDVDRDCVVTNACRCRPRNNRKPARSEIEACKKYLLADMEKYNPKVIFLCGDVACESYLGEGSVSLLRGNVIPEPSRWIVPIFHPSYLLRRKDWDLYLEQLWINDIERGLLKLKNNEQPEYIDIDKIEYRTLKDKDTFLGLIDKILNKGKVFVFDFETHGHRPEVDSNEFLCVGFISDVLKKVYIADKAFIDEDVIFSAIGKITSNKNIVKVCQNLKFEMSWVKYRMKQKFVKPYDDTMLMSYVIDERVKTNGLKWMAFVNYGVKDYSKAIDENNMASVPIETLHKYNAIDVYVTYRLWQKFKDMIRGRDLEVYKKLLLGSVPLLVAVEYRGCGFDLKRLEELKRKYQAKMDLAMKEIYELDEVKRYGKPLDINSPKQIAEFLFDYLKVPPLKTTPSGNNSTDESVLIKLAQRGNIFADKLVRYRHLSKIYNTYLKKFDEYVIDGRIKTNYWLVGTVTGRLSSDSPNLQNIPKGEFIDVRSMFIPLRKGEVILSCDYSQWEVRVLQMYARDENLGRVIREGLDMHKKYAMKIFGVDENHPKFKEYRQATKGGFVFATMYGAGVKTVTEYFWDIVLRDRFHNNFEEAKRFIMGLQWEFFSDYPGIRKWIEELRAFYAKNGYIETLFGRKRRAPIDPTQLVNTPVQSAASDFTLLSAQRIYKDLKLVPVLMIHDDLTYSVPEKEWREYYREIKKRMTDWDFDFVNVPIDVEAKVGERWGEQEVVEE